MPSSERQREANRRNGRQGGPKTEAGKERSRLNSLKHGLTSSTLVVLPEEDPHEYDEVLRGFRESFQPQSAVEDALVLRLAQAHWRSLRSRRLETGMLNTTAAVQCGRARQLVEDCPEHLNLHNAIGVGFMTMPPERWQMYLRYDTTISRDFFRTLDALTRLQRARQQKAEPNPPLARAAGSATQLSDSGIRSVLQTSPVSMPDTVAASTTVAEPRPQEAVLTSPAAPQPNEQQQPTHESKHQRTPRCARRVRRKERRLRRLLASARVRSRNTRRESYPPNHLLRSEVL